MHLYILALNNAELSHWEGGRAMASLNDKGVSSIWAPIKPEAIWCCNNDTKNSEQKAKEIQKPVCRFGEGNAKLFQRKDCKGSVTKTALCTQNMYRNEWHMSRKWCDARFLTIFWSCHINTIGIPLFIDFNELHSYFWQMQSLFVTWFSIDVIESLFLNSILDSVEKAKYLCGKLLPGSMNWFSFYCKRFRT